MPQKQQQNLSPTTPQCHWLMERPSSAPASPATPIQWTGVEVLGGVPGCGVLKVPTEA